jgi:hypothetical protein
VELSAASPAAAAAVDLVELARALIAISAKQCNLFGSCVLLMEVLKGKREMEQEISQGNLKVVKGL